jgi:quercetin dioxygenase-like cupin family protein
LTIAIAVAVSFAVAARALAQDPVQVAPDKCKVLLDNENVRVYEFTLKAGETMPMHSHPRHAIYVADGCSIKISTPDGKSEEAEFKSGQAYYSAPVTHQGVNTGTTQCRLIITEIKPHKAAPMPAK